jgi:hypothetical protein
LGAEEAVDEADIAGTAVWGIVVGGVVAVCCDGVHDVGLSKGMREYMRIIV